MLGPYDLANHVPKILPFQLISTMMIQLKIRINSKDCKLGDKKKDVLGNSSYNHGLHLYGTR